MAERGNVFGNRETQRIANAVRKVERQPISLVGDNSTTQFDEKRRFEGIITDAGPDDADDYTNHRYWIKRVRPTNTNAAEEPVEMEPFTDEARSRIITATNLAEIEGESHALPKDLMVMVYWQYDQSTPPKARYYFSQGPPEILHVKVTTVGTDYANETMVKRLNTDNEVVGEEFNAKVSLKYDVNEPLDIYKPSNSDTWRELHVPQIIRVQIVSVTGPDEFGDYEATVKRVVNGDVKTKTFTAVVSIPYEAGEQIEIQRPIGGAIWKELYRPEILHVRVVAQTPDEFGNYPTTVKRYHNGAVWGGNIDAMLSIPYEADEEVDIYRPTNTNINGALPTWTEQYRPEILKVKIVAPEGVELGEGEQAVKRVLIDGATVKGPAFGAVTSINYETDEVLEIQRGCNTNTWKEFYRPEILGVKVITGGGADEFGDFHTSVKRLVEGEVKGGIFDVATSISYEADEIFDAYRPSFAADDAWTELKRPEILYVQLTAVNDPATGGSAKRVEDGGVKGAEFAVVLVQPHDVDDYVDVYRNHNVTTWTELSPPPQVYPAVLEQESGEEGDKDNQASWTYKATVDGKEVGTGLSPEWRPHPRRALAATSGLVQLTYGETLTCTLLMAFETLEKGSCGEEELPP